MPATAQQVKDLETALTQQFFNLVQGARFRINLARRGDPKKPLSENKAFVSYNATFVPLVNKWINREVKYEQALLTVGVKGIIATGDLKYEDFFYAASLPKLDALVKKWDKDSGVHGIGFIPLLIWAVVIIIGLFTAKTITDDLTTTTQEKAQLLDKTAQTCKELNLTPDQCNAMISQTQAEASQESGIVTTVKWLAVAAAVAFIGPPLLKSTSKT
jgi:hypothetical protein